MKHRFRAVAAAVTLAASSGANATIADGTARGGAELFLSVVDEGAQVSYVRDLGITYADFMADTSATYSFAADANWATFVGLVGGSTENLIYNVAALNLQGGTLNRFLTTTNADVTISTNRPTNSLLGTSYPSVNDYVDQTNLLTATRNASTHGATDDVDGSSIAFGDPTLEDGDDGLAYFGNGSGRRWNLAQSPFDTTESVGTALSFYELRRSSANAISRASMDLLPNQWLLATDGTLTYGAPVPEPETWAMLLAGGALLGAVRLRRRGA